MDLTYDEKLKVIKSIIGNLNPIGSTHVDDKILKNLEDAQSIIESLLIDIEDVRYYNIDKQEYSMKVCGKKADKCLKDLKSLLGGWV